MRKIEESRWVLSPESGVEIINSQFVATSNPSWLCLDLKGAIRPGSWIRLRYGSSIFDDNVRPLIRFGDGANEGFVQPMNGTLFGVGEWIGYIPKNASTISISPVARIGPFDFRIERIEHILPMRLLLRGALSNPGWIAWMIWTQMIGARDEARRALKLASTSTAFTGYDRWHRRLSRAVDLDGIDRPRADWSKTPHLRLFMSIGGALPSLAADRSFADGAALCSLVAALSDRCDCPSEQQAEIRRHSTATREFRKSSIRPIWRALPRTIPTTIFAR